MRYGYCYKSEDGRPLSDCPDCKSDLGREDAITIVLSVADQAVNVPSRLEGGLLVDTDDGAVAKGYHSATLCGRCNANLADVAHELQERF